MIFDGVGFVMWLRDEGADLRHGYWLTDHNIRVLRACEAGQPIDEEQADLILTRLDLHLHLVPAHLRIAEGVAA